MTDDSRSRAYTPAGAITDFNPQFTPKHKAASVESFAKISVGGKSRDASSLNVSASKDVLYSDKSEWKRSKCQAYSTVIILLSINLLNYMDRYTIAAVLLPIQQYFEIGDGFGGLLQTVFICAYMIFAPVFGYLGDRYSRKLIMIAGIFIWSSTVLLSSFVDREHFYLFVLTRAVVGIGEASYSTVSPTIIADLFAKDQRSLMLMLFYFAIPVGSGLGYVLGGAVASFTNSWQWGVRNLVEEVLKLKMRQWQGQITLCKTCSIYRRIAHMGSSSNSLSFNSSTIHSKTKIVSLDDRQPYTEGLTLIFGVVTCLSGFVGVTIGSMWATYWRKTNGQADALVCAIGLLLCLPFYFIVVNYGHLFSRLILFEATNRTAENFLQSIRSVQIKNIETRFTKIQVSVKKPQAPACARYDGTSAGAGAWDIPNLDSQKYFLWIQTLARSKCRLIRITIQSSGAASYINTKTSFHFIPYPKNFRMKL
uniref:Major facilitator superfamily (MFS) profile domain-containing protein n=1 Tax=Romanomermis culicivorax TaxID=13658 RepID=A0A915K5X5_ROMCU